MPYRKQIAKWQKCLLISNYFIYLFLIALGLRCCARAFSSCGEQGLMLQLWWEDFSCCRALAPGYAGFSSFGTWAQLPHGMWDLPRPGIEPVSLALQGRFFNHQTTREAPVITFNVNILNCLIIRKNWQDGLKNMIQLYAVYERLTLDQRTQTG